MTSQFDRVAFHGQTITRRQRQALHDVEKELGFSLHLYQGSWEAKTSYSGTTHTRAGVCDVYVYGMSNNAKLRTKVTRALRKVGCQAAFLRGPKDKMPWHWHVVDLDTRKMDPNAAWQALEYRKGNNGLNTGVKDRYPYRPSPIRVFVYEK